MARINVCESDALSKVVPDVWTWRRNKKHNRLDQFNYSKSHYTTLSTHLHWSTCWGKTSNGNDERMCILERSGRWKCEWNANKLLLLWLFERISQGIWNATMCMETIKFHWLFMKQNAESADTSVVERFVMMAINRNL